MAQTTTERPKVIDGSPEILERPTDAVRGTLAVLVIAVGSIFLIVTLWQNLFTVGPAFEEMIDGFRPVLADEALDQAATDVGGLGAVAEEFQTDLFPALSQALGLSGEELQGFIGDQFPAVATGVAALPEISTTFDGLVSTLGEQQDLFNSADEIPTKDLSATSIPWFLAIAGILVIGAGLLMLRRGSLGSTSALGLGAALIAAVLILSLIPKASDADQLNENLFPIYTAQLVSDAQGALQTVGAMGEEMQTAMLPALAEQLQMQPEEVNAFLGQFPATAATLETLPVTMERFDGLVATFDHNLDNYETIEPVAFSPIIWMVAIGGAVVMLLGGAALLADRRRVL